MFLELIATIFAGFAVAGVVMLIGRASGGRLPKWLAPVAAGLAMIAVTISSEYGWYERTRASLPEGVVVAETGENRSLYRPWTYLVPFVERFAAIDTSTAKTHPGVPGQYLTEVYFFGRWAPVSALSVRLDCTGWRRAVVTSDSSFGAGDGLAIDWVSPSEGDGLLSTFCGGL
ncbi:hypothetical protein PXK00_09110 [Phaeobacter sp. QD34_3]|uniref:hypothetical protein n=1 Tax=unclassified Phaeobacter TaxID=2621772 RepID=UPI00237F5157|nr:MULTISPECIES: hypothetical protein [unclassified Phaeobacter]MDE4133270.1 hypothetical protein [Phaeobacter sp. QD34_3]MDE4136943.1 hypothetical protein [Phaeobacter sp. QD34_24]